MIHLTHATPVFVAIQPADFRKGLDGFIALCRGSLAQDPRQDARFVFINKRRTLVRVVCYDGTGFWLMTKRLSKGSFQGWPRSKEVVCSVTAKHLRQLLTGSISMTNVMTSPA